MPLYTCRDPKEHDSEANSDAAQEPEIAIEHRGRGEDRRFINRTSGAENQRRRRDCYREQRQDRVYGLQCTTRQHTWLPREKPDRISTAARRYYNIRTAVSATGLALTQTNDVNCGAEAAQPSESAPDLGAGDRPGAVAEFTLFATSTSRFVVSFFDRPIVEDCFP